MSKPKRWLFHGILSDTPFSAEDEYFTEQEILGVLKRSTPQLGIRIESIKLTPLPERKKRQSLAEKAIQEAEFKPPTATSPLTKLRTGSILKTEDRHD